MIRRPVSPPSRARGPAVLPLVCLLAASCTLPADERPPTRTPVPAPSLTGTPACFYAWEVQDFQVLDQSNLIIKAPNDRHAYHVRISPPAPELRFAEGISFLPAQGRLCGYAGERLILGPPRAPRRFAIIGVSRLSPRQSRDAQRGARGRTGARGAPASARPRGGD